jgi:O-antigen ligase
MENPITKQTSLENDRGNFFLGILISFLCLILAYVFTTNIGLLRFSTYQFFVFVTGATTSGPYIITGFLFLILNTLCLCIFNLDIFQEKTLTRKGLKWGYLFIVIVVAIVIVIRTFGLEARGCC